MSALVHGLEVVMLATVVLSCWAGVVGMLRAPDPTAALHFLAIPATVGSFALVAAVFLRTGNSQAAWKTVLISAVMLAINAVVAHGSARAFRTRELGRWQPGKEEVLDRQTGEGQGAGR